MAGLEFLTKANTSQRDRALVETEVLDWIERYLQVELVLELDGADCQCPLPFIVPLTDFPNAFLEACVSSAFSLWAARPECVLRPSPLKRIMLGQLADVRLEFGTLKAVIVP